MYGYRAIDALGTIQTGVLPGESPDTVAERVRRMGLRPIAVSPKRGQIFSKEFSVGGGGAGRTDALALFSRQLSTMTDAGTPIRSCLQVLERQREGKHGRALAEVVKLVRADIENGAPLSDALARRPEWFDEFYVSMVRAGEAGSSLPMVLERLADATESRSRLRRRIRSAMAYPTAVACLIGLTVIAMLTYLIPTFSGIFADLKGSLPLPTRIVILLSHVMTAYLPLVVFGVVAFLWLLRRWRRTPAGELRFDQIKLRLPVFGKLATLAALARFSRSLAVLVHTGVPAVDAISVASSTAGSRVVSDAATASARSVSNGGRLSDGLAKHPVFTDVVVQMVSVGEDTGSLDEMLVKVADMYELQVNTTVDSLTSLLEPLLIVAMGLVVGGMLLAVYLPMFKAISLVK